MYLAFFPPSLASYKEPDEDDIELSDSEAEAAPPPKRARAEVRCMNKGVTQSFKQDHS